MVSSFTQTIIFAFFSLAFLINMPVFPLHLWLPDVHTEASTQGSMLLSGVLTKFGGYGMLLAFTLIPAAANYSLFIALLGGFSAFYAAFVLMTQHDIKRVIAYTTIVEMSIILIGIASLNSFGTAGATFAMLAHGFAIAMLFLIAGSIGHIFASRDFRMVKGVIASSAATGYTFLIGIFATTGVPLTAAFIGDVLIFIGAIKAFSIIGAIPLLALGIVGTYLYYIINKSVLSTKEVSRNVEYIGVSQKIGYAVLVFFIFLFGLLPFLILNFFNL
jgi:NADH-quinone oxidoreductase subunit M